MHLFAPISYFSLTCDFTGQQDLTFLTICSIFKFSQNWNIIFTYLIFIFSWTVSASTPLDPTVITPARFACRIFSSERRSQLHVLASYNMAQICKSFVLKTCLLLPSFPLSFGLGTFSSSESAAIRFNSYSFTTFHPNWKEPANLISFCRFFTFHSFFDVWFRWLDVFFVNSGRIKMLCFLLLLTYTTPVLRVCIYCCCLSYEKRNAL